MRVERTTCMGWPEYPVYRVYTHDDYRTIVEWMWKNECDEFLLGSGNGGYYFQVRKNHEWFILRWS